MKITILGSSGQVGAYLTQYFKAKGHDVIEFDKVNFSYGRERALHDVSSVSYTHLTLPTTERV